MQTAKRRWLYSGLALVHGVGLVRPAQRGQEREDGALGECLTLIGDELADGLQTALGVLGREAGVEVEAIPRRGSTVASWLDEGWFAEVLAPRPRCLVAAFRWGVPLPVECFPVPTGAMRVAQADAELVGAQILWVAPPGVLPDAVREVRENVVGDRHGVISSEGLEISMSPDGARPSALGFAGWAGAVWRQLESGA